MELLGVTLSPESLIPVIIIWFLLAVACEQVAKYRGRSRWGWFLFSLLFPLALVVVLLYPPKPRD